MADALYRRQMAGDDSLFALVAWELWKERNGRCFYDNSSMVLQVLAR